MNTIQKVLVGVAALVPASLLVIQLVPYGRAHTNPPVVQEPNWDSPQTRALAERACFDCHSNETVWPWYSNVAPLSWMVQDHVDEGREVLNFSEWNRPQEEAHEAGEALAEGEMPLPGYLWLPPEANLTAAEKEALIRGLDATLGGEGGEAGEAGEGGSTTTGAEPGGPFARGGAGDHDDDGDDD